MKISKDGVELIKRFEGCFLHCYDDGKGVRTIGYGHTGPKASLPFITQEMADQLLLEDLAWVELVLVNNVAAPLTQSMYDALCSFVFWAGGTNFRNSTLRKVLNAQEYEKAPGELCRWYNPKEQQLHLGLLRRRVAEAELFLRDGWPKEG